MHIAPNLLNRDFLTTGRDQVWVTDVTAVYAGTEWLYLAAIRDLFSRAVVAWATSANNDTTLALAALQTGVRHRRPPPGLIHHSDPGSPYASDQYTKCLRSHEIEPSMSRTGDC